jgi:YD repeat-containing protein
VAKNCFFTFVFGAVFFFCCPPATACMPFGSTVPPQGAGVTWFTYDAGDPLIPGAQCVCGIGFQGSGGTGPGSAGCFVPTTSTGASCCNSSAGNGPGGGAGSGGGSGSPGGPASGGAPINLATGNTFITEQDLKIPGLGGGLTLTRTWNSRLRSSLQYGGMFGPGWRSTYEEHIYIDADYTVAYARGDGSVWNFVYGSSTTFTPPVPANTYFTFGPASPAKATSSLFYGPTTWTLVFENGEQRVFDVTTGNLLSVVDRNGNTTQLAYDASFRLTTVTDPVGRHIYFSYASPGSYLVTSVTTDVGVSLSYFYDGEGRMTSYTKPDGTCISFQYGDPNPTLITTVLDSNGIVLESHTYDSQARGLTSSRAGGAEAVTVSYPFGTLYLAAP